MTTFVSRKVSCGVCGAPSEVRVLASVSVFEGPDLDSRPGEMRRSCIAHLIHECSSCGFCASDLAKGEPSLRAVVDSEGYRALALEAGLASRFRRAALASRGDASDKARLLLHAIWALDDAGEIAAARSLRLEVAQAILDVKPSGRPREPSLKLLALDLLRRGGENTRARALLEEIAATVQSPVERAVCALERRLLDEGDEGRHTLDDATQPPPGTYQRDPGYDDDRIQYFLRYAGRRLSAAEREALRPAKPIWDGECVQQQFRERETAELLVDGIVGFLDRLETRLAGELSMNRCPRCDRLARTPTARQCRHCGHDWHST